MSLKRLSIDVPLNNARCINAVGVDYIEIFSIERYADFQNDAAVHITHTNRGYRDNSNRILCDVADMCLSV